MNAMISEHAIERYQERVEPCSRDAALANLDTPTVRLALSIGACGVKLPTGHRLVIRGGAVVTVLPKGAWPSFVGRAS